MSVLSVSGMISSGKTSLVEMLSNVLEVPALYEDVSKNVFMPLYYGNRERYAFTMQVKMLNDRFRNIKEASKTRNTILDQDISADRGAFALTNFQDGGMTEDEWALYKDMSQNMLEELPSWAGEKGKKLPDINIILTTSMERVRRNVRHRGREAEQFEDGDETDQYFTRLNRNFNEYARTYTEVYGVHSLIIDVTDLDFVNKQGDKEYILTTILTELSKQELVTDEEFATAMKRVKESA